MAISEQGHWYDANGKPKYTIVGANGKERNTTLRDARKLALRPSVTTIIGMAAKPGLENWKIDQALLAALTLPKDDSESLDDFMRRAKQDAKDQAIKAAERGTQIHADIERGFTDGMMTVAFKSVMRELNKLAPGSPWVAEESKSNGDYGGKIDLYSPDGIVVDFKTKDGLSKDSDPKKLVYDEHGMQLSAYAMLLGFLNPRRISIFVDRADPSVAVSYELPAEDHKRHKAMFMALCQYWQLMKKYSPRDCK